MIPLNKFLRRWFYRMSGSHRPKFNCPICGYEGVFKDKRISKEPDLVRVHSKCLGCGSNERHRIMYLVLERLFKNDNKPAGKILHIAPEDCMKPILSRYFETYHTADLLMTGVDFKEDIQRMSFSDGSYDCVVVSRVLTIPENLEACVRELRRVLKPGGIAIIAEIHSHEKTLEFNRMINFRSREVGIDILDLYRKHFGQVDIHLSNQHDSKYQLDNRMMLEGSPKDDYPQLVRIPGVGFMELVAVCRA